MLVESKCKVNDDMTHVVPIHCSLRTLWIALFFLLTVLCTLLSLPLLGFVTFERKLAASRFDV